MAPQKKHFHAAALELSNDNADPALWAMAIAEARGESAAAGAAYLRLRAQELADEEAAQNRANLGQSVRSGIDTAAEYGTSLASLSFTFFCIYVVLAAGVGIALGSPDAGGRQIGENILWFPLVSVISALVYRHWKSL